ncbi:ABC transporter substrate-binding protein [Tistrella bauzanensis]|uniref:ABC transporter substrate-binding protein n=1 Tax=Tistrella bauzanensis TaxID=657419 RepID=A0ABQ1IE98_9PROT|nr:ABC transporter substrate-binding protein [Tistrella bauzanensis]GGB33108.1 ABC transporter substrate-binding protein [Tistrella bauzanensis]
MLHTRPRGRIRAHLFAAAASAALTLIGIAGAAHAQSREETLRVVTGGQVNSLDAGMQGITRDGFGLNWNIYDRLVSWDRKKFGDGYIYDFDKMKGELAESFTISDDGLTVTFNLRKDATFHDGSPITAEDVKWSLDRAVSLKGPGAQMGTGSLKSPDQFKIVDDHTIQVTLDKPDRLAVPNLAVVFPVILNSDLAKEHATAEDPWATEWLKENQASGGAYKVSSFKAGQQVVLDRFDDWKSGPLPYFKRIIVQTVPEASTRASLIERGDADLSIDLQSSDVLALKGRDAVKVVSIPQINAFQMIAFNTRMAPFDDPRVRQAVAYALPFDDMFTAALYRRGAPLWGAKWENGLPDTGKFPQRLPFSTNLDKAKALLAEAGHPGGFKTSFSFNVGSAATSEPIAALLKESLAKIGIDVTVEKVPDAQMGTLISEKKLPFFTESAIAWLPSADYFFRVFFQGETRWNYGSFVDEELAELTAKARYERDPAAYETAARRMVAIAAEKAPVVMLWQPALDAVMAKDIDGFTYWFHRQTDYRSLTRTK